MQRYREKTVLNIKDSARLPFRYHRVHGQQCLNRTHWLDSFVYFTQVMKEAKPLAGSFGYYKNWGVPWASGRLYMTSLQFAVNYLEKSVHSRLRQGPLLNPHWVRRFPRQFNWWEWVCGSGPYGKFVTLAFNRVRASLPSRGGTPDMTYGKRVIVLSDPFSV